MNSAYSQSLQVVLEEAVRLQKAGLTDAAERLYHQALRICADHPEANHNLGIISMQRGKLLEGVAYFKRAFEADRGRDLYRRSYSRALLMSGEAALAAQVMEEGGRLGTVSPDGDLEQRSKKAREHLLRGNALTVEGDFPGAIESFKQAIALNPALNDPAQNDPAQNDPAQNDPARNDPALNDAYHHLGSLLAETGRVAEGFDYLMKRAELVKGRGTAPQSLPSETQLML
jgi:tetratricopeptide (TPR) repeat protein